METRFINCDACQTEGRILTNDGGPDDVDHGVCPECNGTRVVEVLVRPVTLKETNHNEFNPEREYPGSYGSLSNEMEDLDNANG